MKFFSYYNLVSGTFVRYIIYFSLSFSVAANLKKVIDDPPSSKSMMFPLVSIAVHPCLIFSFLHGFTDRPISLSASRPPPPPAPLLCKRPSGMESLSSPGSRNIRHLVGVDVEIRWGGGGGGAGSATEGGSSRYIFIAIKPLKTLYTLLKREELKDLHFFITCTLRGFLLSACARGHT